MAKETSTIEEIQIIKVVAVGEETSTIEEEEEEEEDVEVTWEMVAAEEEVSVDGRY